MTGATDAQIQEAAQREWTENAGSWDDLDQLMQASHVGEAAFWASYLVPPGKIITDAAALPSPAVIAALTAIATGLRAWTNPKLSQQSAEAAINSAADCLATLDAYLAAVTEGE